MGQLGRESRTPSGSLLRPWSTQTYSMLLPRKMMFPKFAVGELLLYSTAHPELCSCGLSQSIILPAILDVVLQSDRDIEFSFFTRRFRGFLTVPWRPRESDVRLSGLYKRVVSRPAHERKYRLLHNLLIILIQSVHSEPAEVPCYHSACESPVWVSVCWDDKMRSEPEVLKALNILCHV